MECKVVVFLNLFFVIVKSTTVNIEGEWKENVGWMVKCSWQLFANDSLQSVRLYDDDRQFMVYRPQKDGDHYIQDFRRTQDMMVVECKESVPRGLLGSCTTTIIPYRSPTKDFTFSCEVSGERPKFRIEKQSYNVNWIVPPTDAKIEVGSRETDTMHVLLNCTSSAFPAPQLSWKIGDQYVPSDFKSSIWNMTSKLWHTWSSLSFTPSSQFEAVCIPEVISGNLSITGTAALYNSDAGIKDINDTRSLANNCPNSHQSFAFLILLSVLFML